MSAQLFPKAVIFDLDGTLIHSAPDLHAALNRLMLLEGRRLLEITEVVRMIGDGVPKLVERGYEATGELPSAAQIAGNLYLYFCVITIQGSLHTVTPKEKKCATSLTSNG